MREKMKEVLAEILKQTIGLFEEVKIIGTEENLKVQAVAEKMLIMFEANLEPCPELMGEWALTNLAMLNGLLNFASYKTDDSKFIVKRAAKPKVGETVVAFEFQDKNKTGAKFATMSSVLLDAKHKGFVVPDMAWDVETRPSKAKITEFSQLATLYKEIDDTFRATVVDDNLIFTIGVDHEATHNANMVFASGIEGKLIKDTMTWKSGLFLNIIKIATMNDVIPNISISSRGPIGVTLNTKFGQYRYILRVSDSEKKGK